MVRDETRRYAESARLYDDARLIAGRSLTRSKAPGRLAPRGAGPLYASRGHGATLVDVDGHEYLDFLCALGAISLGYGVATARRQRVIRDGGGGVLSLPTRWEGEAAEALVGTCAPWAESVRFVKTGSEATHAAYRIAKAATGRPYVLMGDWAYHGWQAWSAHDALGRAIDEATLAYPHGADLGRWIEQHNLSPHALAAVFWEPHRWEPTDLAWLRDTRAWCRRHGIVFVADEMIYGGRWRKGGASECFNVQPDLACFGKAIGNGASVAAVVGPAALLEAHGEMVSGTYSGDVTGLAAVCDTLEVYRREDVIGTFWARGRALRHGLDAAVAAHPGLSASVEGAGDVHLRVRFEQPERAAAFAAGMAARGLIWHRDVVNVMWKHRAAHVQRAFEAAEATLAEMEGAA